MTLQININTHLLAFRWFLHNSAAMQKFTLKMAVCIMEVCSWLLNADTVVHGRIASFDVWL